MSERDIDLSTLLDATKKSFGQAQSDLGLPEGVRAGMLISDAELSIKAGMRLVAGELRIEPVSTDATRKGSIMPEALSTVTVRYIAAREEGPGVSSPARSTEEVVREVRDRKDVGTLAGILGDLRVDARYVPALQVWTAAVRDDQDRLVRTINLPDRS
jgi:hypothetical protein